MDIQGLIKQYHQLEMNEGFEGDESDKQYLIKNLISLDICNSLARIDESLESISEYYRRKLEKDKEYEKVGFS